MKIVQTQYVLAVKDIAKSKEYYQTKLGFGIRWDSGGMAALNRESFSIILGECSDDRSAFETRNHSYFAYINVTDVDDVYKEFVASGVDINNHLADKPWGQREFGVQTIDGHRIMFGQEIK